MRRQQGVINHLGTQSPPMPFRQPRFEPIATTNTAPIAATAASTLDPVIVGASFRVSQAVMITSPVPPATAPYQLRGCG